MIYQALEEKLIYDNKSRPESKQIKMCTHFRRCGIPEPLLRMRLQMQLLIIWCLPKQVSQ